MKTWRIWKDPDVEKDWGQEEKGTTEDEMLMASPTQWIWVWVDSRSWWWTGRPGVLRFMGSQRVRHDWATELNWITILILFLLQLYFTFSYIISWWGGTFYILFSCNRVTEKSGDRTIKGFINNFYWLLFLSVSWFEYFKFPNFRVSTGQRMCYHFLALSIRLLNM